MKHSHVSFLLIITLIATTVIGLLSGCKKDNPILPPPDGGSGSTPISDTQRKAAFEAVEQKVASLNWQNYSSDKDLLVQFLKSRSEFKDAGWGDGASVWARFTDGRLYIIADNRAPADTVPLTLPNAMAKSSAANSEIPVSDKATLLTAMGTHYIKTTNALKPMLEAKGYGVTVSEATIEALKTVNGDGLFYITSHGGRGTTNNGSSAYAIWTSTKWDQGKDETYKADWEAGNLAYFTAKTDDLLGRRDTATLETHYAITANFVLTHMSFGENALIYLDACGGSGSPDFRSACVASSIGGTGVTAGWSYSVGDRQAADVAYFVIDRLLGTNMDFRHPETIPQRPRNLIDVHEDLLMRHMDKYTDPKDPALASYFTFTPSTAQFGLLAPSIQLVWVLLPDPTPTINIDGDLGSDPSTAGIVKLGNTELHVRKWINGRITCDAPSTGGNLVVQVRGRPSNTTQITQWRAVYDYNVTSRGTLRKHVIITHDFISDIHLFRTIMRENPRFWIPRATRSLSSSSCTYECSGEYRDPITHDLIETWSGSGSVPMYVTGAEPMGFSVDGYIDSVGRPSQFVINFRASYNKNGTEQVLLIADNLRVVNPVMNSSFAIGGNSMTSGSSPEIAVLSWGDVTPLYPPDPNGPQ